MNRFENQWFYLNYIHNAASILIESCLFCVLYFDIITNVYFHAKYLEITQIVVSLSNYLWNSNSNLKADKDKNIIRTKYSHVQEFKIDFDLIAIFESKNRSAFSPDLNITYD